MTKKASEKTARIAGLPNDEMQDFVTFSIADQLFGLPVLLVQDVLSTYQITRIPLAPPEICGSLNLRGRVVTAMDVRIRLGLAPRPKGAHYMSIVAESEGELYSLMVDTVGEVLPLSDADFERNPPTLDAKLRSFSYGIYRLEKGLLVVLDVKRLLDYSHRMVA